MPNKGVLQVSLRRNYSAEEVLQITCNISLISCETSRGTKVLHWFILKEELKSEVNWRKQLKQYSEIA